ARACSKRVARRAIVEQPTRCSRTCARANLLALGLIEQRACIVDALGGNIEEQAVARLTENVAPVESFLPQLGVAHCHADGPERSDDKESAISENREWNKYRVYGEIRRKLFPESSDRVSVPSIELFRSRRVPTRRAESGSGADAHRSNRSHRRAAERA